MAKTNATEAELVAAVKGVDGYIIGGIENVTDPVIKAADKLKVIAFTGADWGGHVPAKNLARQKGIAITNTPRTTPGSVV